MNSVNSNARLVARTAGVVAIGVIMTVTVALLWRVPAYDTAALGGIAFAVGIITLALGLGLFRAMRSGSTRSVRARAVTLASIPVVAIIAGACVSARAMFVSEHDSKALVLIALGAGTAGVLAALALADQLERARRDVEASEARRTQLESSRRQLVAWVSHDLRTPLAGMRAMSEALADGVVNDPETVQRYHQNMRRESERLGRLMDDLFELSRLQVDTVALTIERVSLGDLVSDAVASASAIASRGDVELIGRVDGAPPVLDLSSPEMLRAVHNLLDNAIRHTPAGGRVEVAVSSDEQFGIVSVCDECGGIPTDDVDRVFDLAFRGDDARSPSEVGGGFGLAIARGLIEAHGGTITLDNGATGCCFTVRLPLAPTQVDRAEIRPAADAGRLVDAD